jgi:hypothetical protein
MFSLFLLGGLTVCFFGRTLFKGVLFITAILMSSFLVMTIFYAAFHSPNQSNWVGWVVLAFSLLLGICLGLCFMKIVHVGVFCLATWGGFCLGIILYNAFMYKMHSEAGFWCFCIGLGLIFGVLALCWFEHILIHATALLGSFMAVYGIGLVAGRYTNPFTIADLIKNHQLTDIDPMFYAYLAGNLVLYGLGCAF